MSHPALDRCSQAQVRPWAFCPPAFVDGDGLAVFNRMLFARQTLGAGERLYLQGQRFEYLHVVLAGSFKNVVLLKNGREQVSQFFFGDDLMGLAGVGTGAHTASAIALEPSITCSVPLRGVRDAPSNGRPWHEVLCGLMAREILREQAHTLLLGRRDALSRVAAFLLEMCDAMSAGSGSSQGLLLRMSRADIGSYLCLRLETVSRALSSLQQQQILEVDKRHITIRSIGELRALRDRDCDGDGDGECDWAGVNADAGTQAAASTHIQPDRPM